MFFVLVKVLICSNMENQLMHFVSIVLHVVNNYKAKQLNMKQLALDPIFQPSSLMPKEVRNND